MPVFIRGGGGKTPKLQGKTISPSTSEQIVKADDGFDGLLQVTVGAMKLMGKVEIPSLNKYTEITAYEGYDALNSVIVEAGFYVAKVKPTNTKTIKVTFTPYSAHYSTIHFAMGLKMTGINSGNDYEIFGFCYDELNKVIRLDGEIYARGNNWSGGSILSVSSSVGEGNLCTVTITSLNDCVFNTSCDYLILISRAR